MRNLKYSVIPIVFTALLFSPLICCASGLKTELVQTVPSKAAHCCPVPSQHHKNSSAEHTTCLCGKLTAVRPGIDLTLGQNANQPTYQLVTVVHVSAYASFGNGFVLGTSPPFHKPYSPVPLYLQNSVFRI